MAAFVSLLIAGGAAAGPSWTDKVTAIGTAVAAAGFVATAIGVWFAFDQLKETRADRHIQVLSDFGRRWDDEHLAEARSLQLKYDSVSLANEVENWINAPHSPSEVPTLLRIPNYFEDLAIMVECGRLELKFVRRSFGTIVAREWEYWEPAIAKMRADAAGSYDEFEKLTKQVRKAESN